MVSKRRPYRNTPFVVVRSLTQSEAVWSENVFIGLRIVCRAPFVCARFVFLCKKQLNKWYNIVVRTWRTKERDREKGREVLKYIRAASISHAVYTHKWIKAHGVRYCTASIYMLKLDILVVASRESETTKMCTQLLCQRPPLQMRTQHQQQQQHKHTIPKQSNRTNRGSVNVYYYYYYCYNFRFLPCRVAVHWIDRAHTS